MSLSLAPRHFVGRIAVLVVALALVQFAATLTLYNRISRDSVREDHARRVAELLEVSERLHARGVPEFAEVMSTRHLQVWQTAEPHVRTPSDGAASQITSLVQRWEPGLRATALQMDIERVGRRECKCAVGVEGSVEGGGGGEEKESCALPGPCRARCCGGKLGGCCCSGGGIESGTGLGAASGPGTIGTATVCAWE